MAREIKIEEYTYELPEEKIAKAPLAERAESKLLVYRNGQIIDAKFKGIGSFLPRPSTLVFNSTKVVNARILFDNPLGKNKPIEIFVLEPNQGISIEKAMLQKNKSTWICLIGNIRDFTTTSLVKSIPLATAQLTLTAHQPLRNNDVFEITFEWNGEATFAEVLDLAGITPLPPYLKRVPDENDKSRYQTVYAKQEGSVAAPTAGLHFTKQMIQELKQQGIGIENVVLHVGAGTFKPVKAETLKDHHMHSEELFVEKETLQHLLANADHLIAVGTTSLRTLESLFWIGVKLHMGLNETEIYQWDAYDLDVPHGFGYKNALETIFNFLTAQNEDALRTKTQLLIAGGYKIRSVNGIITNFHQPNSTLLLLIEAMVGKNWRNIYQHALENNYRFLSYGDSSLLLP